MFEALGKGKNMNEEDNIPVPDTSGSSGSQTSVSGEVELIEAKPLEGLHMARTIEGLASSHSKSLGGEVVSALLAGATNQMACDYQELKKNHKDLSNKFDNQRDELETVRTENAVFKQIINSDRQNKHLRNFSITMGTGLIGTGIYLSRSNLDNFAYGAYGIGVLLVLFGWFTGPKEAK